jgi:hypothetical protein
MGQKHVVKKGVDESTKQLHIDGKKQLKTPLKYINVSKTDSSSVVGKVFYVIVTSRKSI